MLERVLGAALGGYVGLLVGYGVAGLLPESDDAGRHPSWGGPVAIGITVAGAVGGYFAAKALAAPAEPQVSP